MSLPKLVRDRIPEMIKSEGKIPVTRILNSDEYEIAMLTKLKEEVEEVIKADSKEERIEELADVMELIKAIAEFHSSTIETIESIRIKKAEERGAFKERILLEEIS